MDEECIETVATSSCSTFFFFSQFFENTNWADFYFILMGRSGFIHVFCCKVMSLLLMIPYAVPFGADRDHGQLKVTELGFSCVAVHLGSA
jgi:hypothetical protein